MRHIFVYCKKCGLIQNSKQENVNCIACEVPMLSVPSEYLTESGFMFQSMDKRQEFEEIIKNGQDYDVRANQERDSIIKQKNAEHKAQIEEKIKEYNEHRPKLVCPICNSENLTKISNIGKFAKVYAFGILGAGDIGKKYKCSTCGYRF